MQTKLKNKLDQIRTNESGFALTEIMIVLVILGVLAAIAIPIFLSSQNAVSEGDLTSSLLAASTVIQNEKAANNGLYPIYLPADAKKTGVTLTYSYADSRFDYCLRGTASGFTKYIGSKTAGKVTTTACTLPNIGSVDPGDVAPDGSTPSASNNQPVIASLEPASITTRKPGTVVTVNGTGFVNGAVVIIEGQSINALVVNSNKLTFVSPGADTYRSLSLQVKNPNGRTSLASTLNLVNPITVAPGSEAPATLPQPTSSATATMEDFAALKIATTAATCPVSDVAPSVAEYRYIITKHKGVALNLNEVEFVATDGEAASSWRTARNITLPAMETGTPYSFYVQARCTLEGQSSNVSQPSTEKGHTPPIATPDMPLTAPRATTAAPYMVNKTTAFAWDAYTWGGGKTCPAAAYPVYMLFDGATKLWQGASVLQSPQFANGATGRTTAMTIQVICKSTWATSPASLNSPALNFEVVDAPPTPTGTPTLFFTDNGTSYSFRWTYFTTGASSACAFGTKEYQYEAVTSVGNGTVYSAWTTDAESANIASLQGYDYSFKVRARCVSEGTASEPSQWTLATRTTKVLPSSTPTITGSGATATATATCTGYDTTPVYRWYLMDSSSNPPEAGVEYQVGEVEYNVNNAKNIDLRQFGSAYYKDGDKVKLGVESACKSSNTAKTVFSTSVSERPTVTVTASMSAPTASSIVFSTNARWLATANGTISGNGACEPGLTRQWSITNNKNTTVLTGAGPTFTTKFASGSGTVTVSAKLRCLNPQTGTYSAYSPTITGVLTIVS